MSQKIKWTSGFSQWTIWNKTTSLNWPGKSGLRSLTVENKYSNQFNHSMKGLGLKINIPVLMERLTV